MKSSIISNRYLSDHIPEIKLNITQQATKELVIDKILSGEYNFETVDCLCGSQSDILVACKDRYGIPLDTVICDHCGLLRSYRRFTGESMYNFYQQDYRNLYVGQSVASDEFFYKQYQHGRAIHKFVSKHQDLPTLNVLEIGCGAGGIIKLFQDKGSKVVGTDLGNTYLDYGIAQGLKLYNSHSRELIKEFKGSFDIVILSHVLEHLCDIPAELEYISQLLKNDGLLYIEVPGLLNLKNSYDCNFLLYLQNAHNYHFSLSTLRNTMEAFGYSMIEGNEYICSVFKHVGIKKEFQPGASLDVLNFLEDLEKNRTLYHSELTQNKIKFKNNLFNKVYQKISSMPDASVYIYGSGAHTHSLLNIIGRSPKIAGIVTNNKSDDLKQLCGFPILDSKEISSDCSAIVISSDSYQELIYQRLSLELDSKIEIIKIYPDEFQ